MDYKDNLLGVVETVFRWKKVIIYTCLATAVGASVIVLLLPVFYKSTTVFYAASPDLATPEAIFGESANAPNYYGTENDLDRLLSIAQSNDLATFMVDSFNLFERYDIDPESRLGPYNVRLEFDDHFEAVKTKYDALELSMEDQDKEMAAQMVNTAREYIASLGQKLIKESQAKLLRTFEDNIAKKTEELDSINNRLQKARKQYGVYNTVAQSEGLSELVAKAESKLYNSQAKVEALRGVTAYRDTIRFIEASIKGYENELSKLNERLEKFNEGMAMVEVLKEAQSEASEQLAKDKEHYKQIKAAYGTDFPTILLLDEGSVPLVKSRPKRALIVVIATAVAFVFSVIGILLFDTYKDVNWEEVLHLEKNRRPEKR